MENLKNKNWCLHFDEKHIKYTEYQVVVLKNENREVKLEVFYKVEKFFWRDDMAFLHYMISCYRQFKKTASFPNVSFKTLPNISNARWNSRAFFGLLTYILLPFVTLE